MPDVTKKSKKEQQYTLSNEIVLCSKFPEDCQNFYMPEKKADISAETIWYT